MTRPVAYLDTRRALRRDAEAIAAAHPEVTSADAHERCAAWLEGEEPDDAIDFANKARREARDEHAVDLDTEEPDEHAMNDGRRPTRPASRGD